MIACAIGIVCACVGGARVYPLSSGVPSALGGMVAIDLGNGRSDAVQYHALGLSAGYAYYVQVRASVGLSLFVCA